MVSARPPVVPLPPVVPALPTVPALPDADVPPAPVPLPPPDRHDVNVNKTMGVARTTAASLRPLSIVPP
jgi:hypothetical protein